MLNARLHSVVLRCAVFGSCALLSGLVMADGRCTGLPSHAQLTAELAAVVSGGGNAGFGNHIWATVVNRDGVVCAVTFSGGNRGEQVPGGRLVSAQKANTANAFSLPQFQAPLSTANLYSAVQPGGSLFGLHSSNPVNTSIAYRGNAKNYGTQNDPMVGGKIGGVNVFGGGLTLYNADGKLVGGLGVSGDTSCTDHVIAWKVRFGLNLDNIQGGVSDSGTDNIIFLGSGETFDPGFAHPICGFGADTVAADLPVTHPVGPNP